MNDKIIPYRSIVTTKSNNHTWIPEPDDNINPEIHEWNGNLDGKYVPWRYKKIAETLWNLLDDIDAASDIFKPSPNNENSYELFYRHVMDRVKERHEYMYQHHRKSQGLVASHAHNWPDDHALKIPVISMQNLIENIDSHL